MFCPLTGTFLDPGHPHLLSLWPHRPVFSLCRMLLSSVPMQVTLLGLCATVSLGDCRWRVSILASRAPSFLLLAQKHRGSYLTPPVLFPHIWLIRSSSQLCLHMCLMQPWLSASAAPGLDLPVLSRWLPYPTTPVSPGQSSQRADLQRLGQSAPGIPSAAITAPVPRGPASGLGPALTLAWPPWPSGTCWALTPQGHG